MSFDLSDVVEDLASDGPGPNGSYTVERRTPATYTGGRLDVGTTTTFQATLSVQPLTGKDLQKLPEGSRIRGGVTVFSTVELQAGSEPDQIEIDGDNYEVHHVETWGTLGNFWRALALKTAH